jgi:hypothetical protein
MKMNRKIYLYYFFCILIFGIGRWWIIHHYQLASENPISPGPQILLTWVIVFAVLLFAQTFVALVRKLRGLMSEKIRFRFFTNIYIYLISLLLYSGFIILFLFLFYRNLS